MRKLKLKEYCEAPMSFCEIADWNCDDCKFSHKDEALQRKRNGKKIVKPRKKTKGFIEAIEERNTLLKETSKGKKRFVRESFTRGWR